MRRFTQNWQSGHLVNMASNVRRRRGWFLENASPRQLANLSVAATQFALKHETMRAWPVLLKVDISPACNLGCTFCVHTPAKPPGNDLLDDQVLRGRTMSVADFSRLVDQARGRSMAASLYYLGDPLVHPDVDEICAVSRAAALNTHISTNFSFRLSDERIRGLVNSGLTHLTVCVDGMRQDRYELIRVGGRVHLVLDNLDRLLRVRRRLGRRHPRVEVQFIKFQHNLDELETAAAWCRDRGVDQLTDYWGNLHNYADLAPVATGSSDPSRGRRCRAARGRISRFRSSTMATSSPAATTDRPNNTARVATAGASATSSPLGCGRSGTHFSTGGCATWSTIRRGSGPILRSPPPSATAAPRSSTPTWPTPSTSRTRTGGRSSTPSTPEDG